MRLNTNEWDSLSMERQDHLVDRKRKTEAGTDANAEPVGRLIRGGARQQGEWEPDWKLKLLMLRERREEQESDRRRAALARDPNLSEKRSEIMRQAWQAGKFQTRKQAYLKKTPARVERARRLRNQGWTYQEIGEAIGITCYTAMRWLGWTRPAKGESKRCHPVTFQGVSYPSLREAERQTGVPRHTIQRKTSAG